MGMISLQGPKSRAILQTLTNADLSNEAFPFSTNQIIKVSGHEVCFFSFNSFSFPFFSCFSMKYYCLLIFNHSSIFVFVIDL
jgi:hypothetical protein